MPPRPTETVPTMSPYQLAMETRPSEALQTNEALGIRATTFEEAAQLPKMISDETAINILTNNLRSPTGEPQHFVKSFLDTVAPSEDEQAIGRNPERIADLHDGAADLITNNLTIRTVGLEGPQKDYLRGVKEEYRARLERGKAVFRQVAREAKAGGKITTRLHGIQDFPGLTINDSAKGRVDLADFSESVGYARPNIRVQREVVGAFIHWDTNERVDAKVTGRTEQLTKRIYLNPETSASVQTFEKIMKALNEAGIDAKGKMLVRATEMLNRKDGGKFTESIRGDAIVLAAPESSANEVLDLILSLYKDNPEVFVGRDVSKIPTKVAPGIAVGVEDGDAEVSLTSSRAALLEDSAAETKAEVQIPSDRPLTPSERTRAISIYRQKLANLSAQRGISQHNLAFAA